MSQPESESLWPTIFWTLGVALGFASMMGVKYGFIFGGLIGYLIAHRLQLGRQLSMLEQRIQQLESKPAVMKATDRAPVDEPVQTTPTVTAATQPVAAPPEFVSPPASPSPSPWVEPAATVSPATPSAIDLWLQKGLAWLKRGNPIARVGIVILFFGGVFLAKYAVDHALLPLELRLAALAAGALVLLVLGWRLRAKKFMFAQILQGGGVAGLYLTVFAAAKLYHLLPFGFALGLLVAVALASAVLAVAQNALALAVIGFAGGFLAPVLLSTGGGNHVALFSYYTVLNLGVFTVAWFRAWRVLNLVGFVFTFTITGAWRALSYKPENLAGADFFLLLFFLLYVAISILFALRQKPDLRGYVSGSLVFGLPVVVFSLHATLVSHIEYRLALSALSFGAFYLTLAWGLFISRKPNLGLLAEAFAALGVIFASLAIPLAFDQHTTAAMWAVEGAGLVWIGMRQQRKLARAFGVLLQLAAGVGYLSRLSGLPADLPVLNTAYIGSLLLAVSGALTALWFYRNRAQQAAYEEACAATALFWASLWWLYGGLAEINRVAPPNVEYGAALAYAAITLLIGYWLSQRWQWRLISWMATALLPLAAVTGFLAAIRHSHPLADYGFLGWPLLLAAGYWLLYRLDREPDQVLTPFQPWLHGGLFWLIAAIAAWECSWQIGEATAGVWKQLPYGLVPVLLLWCANRPHPLPQWPLLRHRDIYQMHASAPLAIGSALWVFFINLENPGDPVWLPYWPLLNPLDIASVMVMLTLAYFWTSLTPAQRGALWLLPPSGLWAAAAALAFVWLTAALIRALHYGVGTPLDFHGIRHSFPVQASLSIFWSLLGLTAMTLASRRAWRPVWIAGAGLMGVVVVKLFMVDLAGTGGLARIASFLTVGALLLLAGYISPLPPSPAEKNPA